MNARPHRGCLDRRMPTSAAIERFAEETYWEIVVPLFPDEEQRERFVMAFAESMKTSFLQKRLKRRQARKLQM